MVESIVIDPTRIYAYITTGYEWTSASDSYSVCVPVTVGNEYELTFSNTDSSLVGTIFRWGFSDTNSPNGQVLTSAARSSPQDSPHIVILADKQYLVLQFGSSVAQSVISNYFTMNQLSENGGCSSILLRRREMVQASGGPLPEWDYEWDYTKGALDANDNGFTRTATGTGTKTAAITGTYLKFTATSTSYYAYTWPTTYSIGVIEAELYTASNAKMLLCFGNSSYGVAVRLQTSDNYKGIYLGTTSTATKLFTAVAATKYKIRLVLKGQFGDIYVDNNIIGEDLELTSPDKGSIYMSGQGTGSTARESRIYSLKMKFGRI